MKNINIDLKYINEIIKKVIEEITNSRQEILDIVDNARTEYEYLKGELQAIRSELDTLIGEVDSLEVKDKIMRRKLVEVSQEFKKHSEEELKAIYDQASDIRIQYITKKNEEKSLINKRSQLEIMFKKTMKTIENAEKVVNQISIAVSYLKGEILSAMEGMDKESEMFVGMKILEAQENERKRISRDIHDGPAQYMANLVMKADICERLLHTDFEEGLKELSDLKQSVKVALKEVRGIIFDLRPMSLDDLGIGQTIEEFVKSFRQSCDIDVKVRIKPVKVEIESIIQTAVYRIIQEIFNNIRKHSKASHVQLRLDHGIKYLHLIVSDDGVGFDVEKTLEEVKRRGESYGLLGILDRVKQLQGNIVINSTVGVGTVYNVKLPVSREVIQDEKRTN